jgi:hypothetical protein
MGLAPWQFPMWKSMALILLDVLLLVETWPASAAAQVLAQAPQVPLPASNSASSQTVPIQYTQWPGRRYIPIYAVPFSIRAASPEIRFEVRIESGAVVARCVGGCTLQLPLTSFELVIIDERGIPGSGKRFEVTGPGKLEFEGPHTDLAVVSAIVGGAGAAMVLGGSVAVARNLCTEECQDSEAKANRANLGLAAMALGTLLTPIGWYMFGHNISTTIHQDELREPRVAVAGTRNGAVIGISGTF